MYVGQIVYWGGRAMRVSRVGLPGEYGPRVELGGSVITTPELDHRLTGAPDEPSPPSLYECMWSRISEVKS